MLVLSPALPGVSFATMHLTTQDPTSRSNQDQAAARLWYAPDVYDADAPGVAQPELVKEAKPNYTTEAMQARIEGIVRLEAIVEVDGSVGPIRVRHSLDPAKGLDDEAIKCLRRWRFKPGRKEGVPVRTRIAVELSFTLRDSSYRPEVGWPEGFDVKRSGAKTSNDRLAEDVLPFEDVQIKMKYPRDWVVIKGISGQLITIQRIDALEARGCTLLVPTSTEMDLMVPVRNEALRIYEKSMRMQIANDPEGIALRGVGQIGAGHVWIWSEMSRPGVHISSVQSASAAGLESTFEGTRIWRFMTTDSHHELNIVCYVLTPRGSSRHGIRDTLQRAGEDFSAILNGVTVRQR